MFGRNNKLTTDWLKSVSFFSEFAVDELEAVSEVGERRQISAGTIIIDQGEVGTECFVIVDGTAVVAIRGEFVTALGPGTMIGEMALVEHRPRSATVRAETDMVVVAYSIEEFKTLLARSPSTQQRVMGLLQARIAANEERDRTETGGPTA
jgi:CRP-like cAMP-binding protein